MNLSARGCDADRELGREYQVDLQRFVVGAVDPRRGLKLFTNQTATWVSFGFWEELRTSRLLRDASPRHHAMQVKSYVRGAK